MVKNIGVIALITLLALTVKSDIVIVIWFLVSIICGIKIAIK